MENKKNETTNRGIDLSVNELSPTTQKNMTTRVISGIVLAAVCFPLSFLGGWFYFALISIVACFAIYEMIHSIDSSKRIPVAVLIFIFICSLALIYWGSIKNNSQYYFSQDPHVLAPDILAEGFGKNLFLSPIAIAIVLVVMFLVTITSEKFTVEHICYYFTMIVFLALGFQSLFFVRYFSMRYNVDPAFGEPIYKYCISVFPLLFVLISSVGNDLGAYFTGVLFGKHAMNKRISPHKTWEGFVGGIVFSMIITLLFTFVADACGHPVVDGYVDIEHWYYVLICSIVLPLVGVLGDLSFSAIKRHYNIKDFGKEIPGHGGFLDRLDSILFCSIAFTCLIILITNGWDFTL